MLQVRPTDREASVNATGTLPRAARGKVRAKETSTAQEDGLTTNLDASETSAATETLLNAKPSEVVPDIQTQLIAAQAADKRACR